ncbi:MAG: M48 family metalloprotease [Pseudomonadales bacterium]|jgi:predicted Zn-dependent protease|nr:M48 family metalloprotease [Pseudomonadales bacterium]|tara:strand:+ start:52 stop:1494 length:1443 start_codon:yes stop_codon:yes gene_type:complete
MLLRILLGLCLLGSTQAIFAVNNLNLPSLGDHSSGIISLEQERTLGQHFLRSLRAGAPLVDDPILQEYLELLIYRLASHSQLQDRRLDLVIINNKTLNAFAAPGGIVGVNLGLFLTGESEAEISAILTHELAHVSQRHFARRTEASKKAGLANIAGLLAGLILIATSAGDAGMAAITTSQAVTQSEMLRYSRSREAEADRVGIDTLVEADLDPRAMAYMFERLNRSNRINGIDIPEFLLTHPVTKDRIADSYAQTEKLPVKIYPKNLDFHLMRARVQVMTADSQVKALLRMKDLLNSGDSTIRTAARYGLALAQIEAGQLDNSLQNILRLQNEHPNKIAFTLAEAELHIKAERYDSAIGVLEQALKISPNNYPLGMAYAETLMNNREASKSVDVLLTLTQARPNDAYVWYLLAEAYGLARDIVGVHQARAEYFVLVGNFDQAIKQLGFATTLVRDNFQENARIQHRIEEIAELLSETRKS